MGNDQNPGKKTVGGYFDINPVVGEILVFVFLRDGQQLRPSRTPQNFEPALCVDSPGIVFFLPGMIK